MFKLTKHIIEHKMLGIDKKLHAALFKGDGGGGGTATVPGGSDGYVQYNDGGVFGGDAGLIWDDVNCELIITGTTAHQLSVRYSATSLVTLDVDINNNVELLADVTNKNLTTNMTFVPFGNCDIGLTGTRWRDVFTTTTYATNLVLTDGGSIKPSANSTTAMAIAQADGTKFVIFDSTNKRVGIGTTAPTQSLDVNGNGVFGTGTRTGGAEFEATGTNPQFLFRRAASTNSARMHFMTGAVYNWNFGMVVDTSDFTIRSENNSAIQFRIKPGTNAESFTIDGATGNVGIGTTSPAAKLYVLGSTTDTAADTYASFVQLSYTGAATTRRYNAARYVCSYAGTGASTTRTVAAFAATAYNASAYAVASLACADLQLQSTNASATTTAGYGLIVQTPSIAADKGSITSIYGVYVDNQGNVTGTKPTNAYGIYVKNPTNAGTINTCAYFEGDMITATKARCATALYRRYYHLSSSSFAPGSSGATWTAAGANNTSGWQLNASTELLEETVDVHADWDGASDLTVEVYFALLSSGSAGDTVDIRMNAYYIGTGETATKTQAVEVSTATDGTQYKVYKAVFTIDWDAASNVVQSGDVMDLTFNLETDTSEIDNILFMYASFFYNTTHIGIESTDV